MNGVTGRMGTNQHLMRSIVAIRQQGGVQDWRRRVDHARAGAGGPQRREAASPGPTGRRCRAGRPISTPRWPIRKSASISTPRRPTAASEAVQQAIAAGKHVYCEKPAATTLGRSAGTVPPRPTGGPEERRGARQALAAGLAQAQGPPRAGLFRPHPFRPRRVRLLGVRGRHGRLPAPLVELPQGGRRRHHPRHALPLPLRVGQPLRQRPGGFLPRGHARRQALGRARPAVRGYGRRFGLLHLRAGGRHHRAHQRQLVRPRPPRRSVRPAGRRHARAPRWPVCGSAGSSRPTPPRGPCGIPTSPARSISTTVGSRSTESKTFDNAFKAQWELFLRHVVKNEPFPWTLREGAKGIQLAEKAQESWDQRAWVEVRDLDE